jgi:hypothetical protein
MSKNGTEVTETLEFLSAAVDEAESNFTELRLMVDDKDVVPDEETADRFYTLLDQWEVFYTAFNEFYAEEGAQ